jgi:hypothetical protein
MMELPQQPLMQSQRARAMAAVGNFANKKQKRQIHELPSFFQTQMTPEHPEASTLELSHAR